MSESGSLPPAAFDISGLRRAADLAVAPPRGVAVARVAFIVLVVVVVGVGVWLGVRAPDSAPVIAAIGIVLIGVLLAVLVVLPLQMATRRLREHSAMANLLVTGTADALRSHLASIGYDVPLQTTRNWVSSFEPTDTVPLVHDSEIAARWWTPAPGDDRVFVEPFLRQAGVDSALPVLPPL